MRDVAALPLFLAFLIVALLAVIVTSGARLAAKAFTGRAGNRPERFTPAPHTTRA